MTEEPEERIRRFKLNRTVSWSLLTLVVSMLIVGTLNVIYTNEVAKRQRVEHAKSDQRWCAMLTTLDRAYQQAPPQTSTGQTLARQIRELRVEFGCKEG